MPPNEQNQEKLQEEVKDWARPLTVGSTIYSGVAFNDSTVRLNYYLKPLQSEGTKLLELFKNGHLGPHDVCTHNFINLRNQLMLITRSKISSGALAMSEFLKEKPFTEEELRNKYSKKLQAPPKSLVVSEEIMKRSIATNPLVTNQAINMRLSGISGLAFFGTATALQLYKVNDEKYVYEAFNLASEIVGGSIGTWKGVPAIWTACKVILPKMPTRPVLALHVIFNLGSSIGGSVIGGTLAQAIGNKFNDKK